MIRTIALTLALLSGTAHAAEDPTGETLAGLAANPATRLAAISYVRGYVEGWTGRGTVEGITMRSLGLKPELFDERMNAGGNMFCTAAMEPEAALNVVLGYMTRHPEDRKTAISPLVWLALHDAFPCPTSKPVSY